MRKRRSGRLCRRHHHDDPVPVVHRREVRDGAALTLRARRVGPEAQQVYGGIFGEGAPARVLGQQRRHEGRRVVRPGERHALVERAGAVAAQDHDRIRLLRCVQVRVDEQRERQTRRWSAPAGPRELPRGAHASTSGPPLGTLWQPTGRRMRCTRPFRDAGGRSPGRTMRREVELDASGGRSMLRPVTPSVTSPRPGAPHAPSLPPVTRHWSAVTCTSSVGARRARRRLADRRARHLPGRRRPERRRQVHAAADPGRPARCRQRATVRVRSADSDRRLPGPGARRRPGRDSRARR